jgi:PST family polysaccharide transporter
MGASALALAALMWFASSTIVPLFLGRSFTPSESPFRILSLRAPMVAWTNILGFQWLLALGLEKPFQRITFAALALNLALAISLVPRYGANGMACAVVLSQIVVVCSIFFVLRVRGLSPLASAADRPHG